MKRKEKKRKEKKRKEKEEKRKKEKGLLFLRQKLDHMEFQESR